MNQATAVVSIGMPLEGGFFAGKIRINDQDFALIVSPREEGDHEDASWIEDYKDVPGAKSYEDGLANTKAMAEAGSELAKWALGLNIGGFSDWYLPSQDELEIIYRNLKPTADQNYCYARSGINLSALPPTRPYTPEFPIQTGIAEFKEGGEQALASLWYWSSTQHASCSNCAWSQRFRHGGQDDVNEGSRLRARAVRRLPI